MLRVRERTPIPSSIVFTFGLTFESFKEFGGVLMCFGVYLFYQEMFKVEWFEVLQNRLLLEMVGLHFL
jgi:hypothetical protein